VQDPRDKLEEKHLKQFSDYDQTVDVVSCWQSFTEFALTGATFYRFGKFRTDDQKDLTPDFAIGQDAQPAKKAGVGSLVCEVKKIPGPYGDGATSSSPDEIFSKTIDSVSKYGRTMRYVSDFGPAKVEFIDHDVAFMVPSEAVDSVYNYLKQNLKQKPFNVGRPLVLVEYVYSQSDRLERYVFRWKQGEANSAFSNRLLRERMVERAQAVEIYPKHFIPYKIRHVICNDDPPEIYLLVFLWIEVFIKFLKEDDFEVWKLSPTNRIIQIEVTPAEIIKKLREDYAAPISTEQIRTALGRLCQLKKARCRGGSKEIYVINFSNLAGRAFEEEAEQVGVPKRTEFREYGRVFARLLAKKELKERKVFAPTRRKGAGKRRRPPPDEQTLDLPFP
jgi:hypothetical protein